MTLQEEARQRYEAAIPVLGLFLTEIQADIEAIRSEIREGLLMFDHKTDLDSLFCIPADDLHNNRNSLRISCGVELDSKLYRTEQEKIGTATIESNPKAVSRIRQLAFFHQHQLIPIKEEIRRIMDEIGDSCSKGIFGPIKFKDKPRISINDPHVYEPLGIYTFDSLREMLRYLEIPHADVKKELSPTARRLNQYLPLITINNEKIVRYELVGDNIDFNFNITIIVVTTESGESFVLKLLVRFYYVGEKEEEIASLEKIQRRIKAIEELLSHENELKEQDAYRKELTYLKNQSEWRQKMIGGRRIFDEADLMAEVACQYVPKIYEKGSVAGPNGEIVHFTVAELGGKAVYGLMKILSFGQIAKIIEAQLTVFALLHSKNLVYMDGSSNNVLFDVETGPKVIDFGSVKSVGEPQPCAQGTRGFVSPEELAGFYDIPGDLPKSSSATPTKDVYATGMLLYKLLLRENEAFLNLPCEGYKLVDEQFEFTNIISGEGSDILRSLDPELRLRLANVLKKATVANFNNRYQNAQEMLDDFRACFN